MGAKTERPVGKDLDAIDQEEKQHEIKDEVFFLSKELHLLKLSGV